MAHDAGAEAVPTARPCPQAGLLWAGALSWPARMASPAIVARSPEFEPARSPRRCVGAESARDQPAVPILEAALEGVRLRP
jgi:hypothetical protein